MKKLILLLTITTVLNSCSGNIPINKNWSMDFKLKYTPTEEPLIEDYK